jgi:hypothetical protein
MFSSPGFFEIRPPGRIGDAEVIAIVWKSAPGEPDVHEELIGVGDHDVVDVRLVHDRESSQPATMDWRE